MAAWHHFYWVCAVEFSRRLYKSDHGAKRRPLGMNFGRVIFEQLPMYLPTKSFQAALLHVFTRQYHSLNANKSRLSTVCCAAIYWDPKQLWNINKNIKYLCKITSFFSKTTSRLIFVQNCIVFISKLCKFWSLSIRQYQVRFLNKSPSMVAHGFRRFVVGWVGGILGWIFRVYSLNALLMCWFDICYIYFILF